LALNSAENRLRVLMVVRPLHRRIHLSRAVSGSGTTSGSSSPKILDQRYGNNSYSDSKERGVEKVFHLGNSKIAIGTALMAEIRTVTTLQYKRDEIRATIRMYEKKIAQALFTSEPA
jgi:hypothetical protein